MQVSKPNIFPTNTLAWWPHWHAMETPVMFGEDGISQNIVIIHGSDLGRCPTNIETNSALTEAFV